MRNTDGTGWCWFCVYLDEVQHSEGEVLIAEAAVHHHLDEHRQRPRQLPQRVHHLWAEHSLHTKLSSRKYVCNTMFVLPRKDAALFLSACMAQEVELLPS